jgi:uncharacterized protein (TIGR02246 family)
MLAVVARWGRIVVHGGQPPDKSGNRTSDVLELDLSGNRVNNHYFPRLTFEIFLSGGRRLDSSIPQRNLAMKISLVFAALLASLAIISTPLVWALNYGPTTIDNAEQEIRKLNAEEVKAFIDNDPNTMAGLWSDDFVVTNPFNKFLNRQQVLGMIQSGFLVITPYDRQIEYVRVYGDTVIVVGSETVVWGGKMPNAGKTEHLRFTAVWMKQQGRWQEVARHANIVPQ